MRKGLWSPDEDEKLKACITEHRSGSWSDIARRAGLQRCGKSCRRRWMNHLRPDLKRDKFTPDEVKLVAKLHDILGNKWSEIATHLAGRTDNDVKNLWNTQIKRQIRMVEHVRQPSSFITKNHGLNFPFSVDSIEDVKQNGQPINDQGSISNYNINNNATTLLHCDSRSILPPSIEGKRNNNCHGHSEMTIPLERLNPISSLISQGDIVTELDNSTLPYNEVQIAMHENAGSMDETFGYLLNASYLISDTIEDFQRASFNNEEETITMNENGNFLMGKGESKTYPRETTSCSTLDGATSDESTITNATSLDETSSIRKPIVVGPLHNLLESRKDNDNDYHHDENDGNMIGSFSNMIMKGECWNSIPTCYQWPHETLPTIVDGYSETMWEHNPI